MSSMLEDPSCSSVRTGLAASGAAGRACRLAVLPPVGTWAAVNSCRSGRWPPPADIIAGAVCARDGNFVNQLMDLHTGPLMLLGEAAARWRAARPTDGPGGGLGGVQAWAAVPCGQGPQALAVPIESPALRRQLHCSEKNPGVCLLVTCCRPHHGPKSGL